MGSYIDQFEGDHEKKSDLVITVGGKSGAGKGSLSQQISDILGIPAYSAGDFFREIADEKGMSVEELSEKADKETDVEVDRRTLQKGLEESCVIDGRLASWALGDYADLRIFLAADLDKRAERIAEREGIDFEDAKSRTEKRDQDNNQRYKNYYSIDTDNQEIYDVVLDNTDMNLEEQKKAVREVLEKEGVLEDE